MSQESAAAENLEHDKGANNASVIWNWNLYSSLENIVDMSHVVFFAVVKYISHMTLNREKSGGAIRPVC